MTFRNFLESIIQEPFGHENRDNKKELVVLVGPPAVGKSTFVAKKFPPGSAVVISRDEIVEKVARENRLTYDDLFKPENEEYNKEVNRRLSDAFTGASRLGKHVVVDMTNMTPKARRSALARVGGDFFKRAVVFTMKGSDLPELLSRMEKRSLAAKESGGSKTIGKDVIMRMIGSYQSVTPEEGFDRVDTVDSFLKS